MSKFRRKRSSNNELIHIRNHQFCNNEQYLFNLIIQRIRADNDIQSMLSLNIFKRRKVKMLSEGKPSVKIKIN